MRQFFSVLVALAIAFCTVASATSAPIAPGDPVHMWLFDAFDVGNGYAIVDQGTSATPLNLYTRPHGYVTSSGYVNGVLVGDGDPLGTSQPSNGAWQPPNASILLGAGEGTPFAYTGNKSAALDWKSGNNTYPTRTYAGGLSADVAATTDLLSSSGTISLWYKPIKHTGTGEQYLFTFRDSVSGSRFWVGDAFDGTDPDTQAWSDTSLLFRNVPPGTDQVLPLTGSNIMNFGSDNAEPGPDWYNLVFTWDAGGFDAYQNGTLIGSNALAMLDFQPNIFQIGSYSNYTAGAPGLYDEFAIWDTALSADNVEWLFQHSLTELSSAAVPEPGSAVLLLVGLAALYPLARWGKKLGIVK